MKMVGQCSGGRFHRAERSDAFARSIFMQRHLGIWRFSVRRLQGGTSRRPHEDASRVSGAFLFRFDPDDVILVDEEGFARHVF